MVVQLENRLPFVKCIVHNLYVFIYFYILCNDSQPVWHAYANVVDAISMNVNDVGTISVDVIGIDVNILDVIITDAIVTDEKVFWIGDAHFNKISIYSYVARCQGNEIEQWRSITRFFRIASIIKWLTGLNGNQFEFDYLAIQ